MSNYNIIELPSITPMTLNWGLQRFDGVFASPLTGSIQTIRRGARWTCTLNWDNKDYDKAQMLAAFFTQMADLSNVVLIHDFSYIQRGSLSGYPKYYRKAGDMDIGWLASLVYTTSDVRLDSNGAVQSVVVGGTSGTTAPTWNTTIGGDTIDGTAMWNNLGIWTLNTIVGYGAPNNVSDILLQGDMVQLATAQLVQVVDPSVNSNASGHFLVHIAPRLRTEPLHTSALTLSNPSCYMQSQSPSYSRSAQPPARSTISASFSEAIL